MKCAEVKPLLQDFLDGRLSRERADQVRTHVASCAACSRELDLYSQVFAALDTESMPDVQLADAVMARIHVQRSAASRWSVWAYAAACTLVTIGLCLALRLHLKPIALCEAFAARTAPATHDWAAATGDAFSGVVERFSDIFAAAAGFAWRASMPSPQIPVFLILAACAVALAVDLYCLRRALPLAGARQLVL